MLFACPKQKGFFLETPLAHVDVKIGMWVLIKYEGKKFIGTVQKKVNCLTM